MENQLEQLLNGLTEPGSHRKDLSDLRAMVRENPAAAQKRVEERIPDILPCLKDEDPKTRKNAATLLSELLYNADPVLRETAGEALFKAYEKEETLYVRAAYLMALQCCDCSPYLLPLRERLTFLSEKEWEPEELKHIREERRWLEEILAGAEEKKHKLRRFEKSYELLLICDPVVREDCVRELGGNARAAARGVRVRLSDAKMLEKIRYYQEAWFLIPVRRGSVFNAENIGQVATNSALLSMLDQLLGGNASDSYSFRLEIKSPDAADTQGTFLRKKGYEIEEASQGRLRNLPGNYEVTLILVKRKDGAFAPYLRLEHTDHRFDYRTRSEATSMTPVRAAEAVELIRPYLMENAQVMDPFCGVGTLLIERALAESCHDIYGTDTYGQAILGARENAENAGFRVNKGEQEGDRYDFNFINRDFFDFTHIYLFDEILTECPDTFGKTPEEKDRFFRRFFDKSMEITTEAAMLFVISGEEGQIRKQIRLHKELKLLRAMALRKNQNIYVIEKRAEAR